MEVNHELYIKHCFNLARKGGKFVGKNPQVGAVIVADGRIIGEGWHQKYGEAHAEINAFRSVKKEDQHLINGADIYVTLEPCNSTGNTGPCSEAILENGIKRVFVSALDPTIEGKSLEYLKSKGVEVKSGIIKEAGEHLIKSFHVHQTKERPFVILKYAQSKDYYFAKKDQQYWISNEYSKLQVHKWRSEVDGILIGVNTLLIDNPQLTTRLYPGESPRAIIIDQHLKSDPSSHIFNSDQKPIIFSANSSNNVNAEIVEIDFDNNPLEQVMNILYGRFGIARLMVEGGAKTLKYIIQEKLWDEARIITGSQKMNEGIKSPAITGQLLKSYNLASDHIKIITPHN